MAQPARAFHAIDGLELHALAVKCLEELLEGADLGFKAKVALFESATRQLGLDTRFEPHLTYPRGSYNVQVTLNPAKATWLVEVTVKCDLHEPSVWTSTARGSIGEARPVIVPAPPVAVERTSGVAVVTDDTKDDEGDVTQHLGGEDLRDRKITPQTAHGLDIDTDTKDFSLEQLPEAERLAILAERETIQKRNDRAIAEAKAAGQIVLTGEGDLDKPNAARKAAGLPVPARQRGEDGRSYDVEGHAPAIEESI